jgi:LmbE family N-acetylglucosaminyl deacetylase
VKPDIAFMLWNRDRHPDHEAAAAISGPALRQTGMILNDTTARGTGRIYAYDNGPGHTIGFEPNTYVDVTPDWPAAMEWLGQLMAFVQQKPYEPGKIEGALNVKETLAKYRGLACGAKYAEALWATAAFKQEIF